MQEKRQKSTIFSKPSPTLEEYKQDREKLRQLASVLKHQELPLVESEWAKDIVASAQTDLIAIRMYILRETDPPDGNWGEK